MPITAKGLARVAVLTCCLATPLQAQDASPAPRQQKTLRVAPKKSPLKLSLHQCIALALIHNLDIQVEAYNPLINKQDIITTRSVFDLSMFSDTTWTWATTQTSTVRPVATQAETRSASTEAGFRKATIAGTSYQISLFAEKSKTLTSAESTTNPIWSSGVAFSVTQPLLRGFGSTVNTADILIAQNTRDSSIYKFQETTIKTVTDVELRYWDLVFARENLRVKQLSLEQSRDLLKITKAKVEAGDLAQIDILQSETNVSQREEEIIVAENAVRDAEDQLKNLIKPLDEKLLWQTELIPTEPMGTLASLNKYGNVDLTRAIQSAIASRPELLQLRSAINSSHLAMVKAQNQLWPKLDVTSSLRFNGFGPTFDDSTAQAGHWHFFEWSVGLAFEYPLGNRSARASYRKTSLQHQQAKLSLKRSERAIIINVRQSHRQIASTLKRIRATEKSVSLASRQLDAERKKFDVGLSTLFRVKEFIEDLIQARTNAIKAKVDFLQALTRMRQADATTMERLAQQKILLWTPSRR